MSGKTNNELKSEQQERIRRMKEQFEVLRALQRGQPFESIDSIDLTQKAKAEKMKEQVKVLLRLQQGPAFDPIDPVDTAQKVKKAKIEELYHCPRCGHSVTWSDSFKGYCCGQQKCNVITFRMATTGRRMVSASTQLKEGLQLCDKDLEDLEE